MLLRRWVKALSRSEFVEWKKEDVTEYAAETIEDNSCSDFSNSFFIRASATLSLLINKPNNTDSSVDDRPEARIMFAFFSNSCFLSSIIEDAFSMIDSNRSFAWSPTH